MLEEIVVTGNRSQQRTLGNTPTPLDVISGEQLQSGGAMAHEFGQALLATAPSFFFPRQSNSGTSDHVRAGQLRGLSPDQLLVLINGKRRHTSAVVHTETKIGRGTAAVDFNTIPLNAIKRIEVLRDGAGAQYGSDAIAGVINVILDSEPGFEAALSLGEHLTTLEPIDASLKDGETVTFEAKYGFKVSGPSWLKFGLAMQDRNRTNRAGLDAIPFFIAQTTPNLNMRGKRLYSEGDPEAHQINLWWNGETQASSMELFSFGTIHRRKSKGGSAFFRYPDSQENTPSIYPNGYRPSTRGTNKDLSATAGARTEIGGWGLEGSTTIGKNNFRFGVEQSLNASLGPASPTSFDSGAYEFSQIILNLDASKTFPLSWTSRPMSISMGLEYRHENFETKAGETASYVAGDYLAPPGAQAAPGLTPNDADQVLRNVASLYLEAGIQLTPSLFITSAARFEHYSDSKEATTGKVAAHYQLNEHLAVRSTISNNFRVPNLAQIGFSDTTLNFGQNRSLIRTRTLPVKNPIVGALGGRNLKEESSFNTTTGIILVRGNLSATVDGFYIKINDRISLSERLFGAELVNFMRNLPDSTGLQSVRFFTNGVDTKTRGVEATVKWEGYVLGGNLEVSGSYSVAKTEISSLKATTSELLAIDPNLLLIGVEETNTIESAAPKSKGLLTVTWHNQRLKMLARLSYYGAATRVFNFGGGFEPSQKYGDEFQLDIEATFKINERISIGLGATNILDQYPDLSSPLINYFNNLPYDILSPIGVNGRYVYSQIRMAI